MTAALTSVGVQQVSITIASGATTGTATITAVGAGAFIVWDGQTTTDSSTAVSALARIEITNTTTITATRNTSSTDTITINAVVIDGDATNLIKSVQSGTTTILTAATTGTSTISAVTNTNTAIFFLGTSTASAAGSLLRVDCNVSLAGTTVTATRGASSGADVVGWCVVEYQAAALNSSTQNFSVTTTATGTSFSTTISSVTTGNTMLAFGGFVSGSVGIAGRDYPRLSLASATSVQTDYSTAPLVTTGVTKGVVIEFVSGILAQTIQRGTITITAGTSNTATITSAATAQTLANWLNNTTNNASTNIDGETCRITQTNATTLTQTSNTSQTAVGSYEVVTFNPAAGGGGGSSRRPDFMSFF